MGTVTRDMVLEHFSWIDGHADVWASFNDGRAFAAIVAALVEPFRAAGVTAMCGIESRGFILGGAAAAELGVGFVAVRKGGGLFPGEKLVRNARRDYRGVRHTLRLQRASVQESDHVLLVDDWIETGSQAGAVYEMVRERNASWAGCSVIVDELSSERELAIGPIRAILSARELPPDPEDR